MILNMNYISNSFITIYFSMKWYRNNYEYGIPLIDFNYFQ
jgi:hypothetical protein